MILKPATPKARALLNKLEALAEKGVDGERTSAQAKIMRLRARYDFTGAEIAPAPDLFSGAFKPASKAACICSFAADELELASAVKWAVESATKIRCLHRGNDLLAHASPPTARRLRQIADHIAFNFRCLLRKFAAIDGVSVSDRSAFVMGLYDGMMNESRAAGQRLPGRARPKGKRAKRASGSDASRLDLHPYTLAASLGKQIRFSAPAEQIAAELDAAIQKQLAAGKT